MKKLFFALVISALFINITCMEKVDYLKSNLAQKPVVNCFFSTDSTFKVYVGLTTEIFSEESDSVPDASVIVYSEQGDTIVFNKKSKYLFESDSVAKKGVLYHLLVQSSLFDDVTAQNLIPLANPVIDTVIFRPDIHFEDDRYKTYSQFLVNFQDIENSNNYYEISALCKTVNITIFGEDDTLFSLLTAKYLFTENPFIENQNYGDVYPDFVLFSDIKFANENIALNINFKDSFFPDRDIYVGDLIIIVKNVSQAYFNYRYSIILQDNNYNFNSFDTWSNMMFVNKNIKITGNLNGAFGVFAGYNIESQYVLHNPNNL